MWWTDSIQPNRTSPPIDGDLRFLCALTRRCLAAQLPEGLHEPHHIPELLRTGGFRFFSRFVEGAAQGRELGLGGANLIAELARPIRQVGAFLFGGAGAQSHRLELFAQGFDGCTCRIALCSGLGAGNHVAFRFSTGSLTTGMCGVEGPTVAFEVGGEAVPVGFDLGRLLRGFFQSSEQLAVFLFQTLCLGLRRGTGATEVFETGDRRVSGHIGCGLGLVHAGLEVVAGRLERGDLRPEVVELCAEVDLCLPMPLGFGAGAAEGQPGLALGLEGALEGGVGFLHLLLGDAEGGLQALDVGARLACCFSGVAGGLEGLLPVFDEALDFRLELTAAAALGLGAILGDAEVFVSLFRRFFRFFAGLLGGAEVCFRLAEGLQGGFVSGFRFAGPVERLVGFGDAPGAGLFQLVDACFGTSRPLKGMVDAGLVEFLALQCLGEVGGCPGELLFGACALGEGCIPGAVGFGPRGGDRCLQVLTSGLLGGEESPLEVVFAVFLERRDSCGGATVGFGDGLLGFRTNALHLGHPLRLRQPERCAGAGDGFFAVPFCLCDAGFGPGFDSLELPLHFGHTLLGCSDGFVAFGPCFRDRGVPFRLDLGHAGFQAGGSLRQRRLDLFFGGGAGSLDLGARGCFGGLDFGPRLGPSGFDGGPGALFGFPAGGLGCGGGRFGSCQRSIPFGPGGDELLVCRDPNLLNGLIPLLLDLRLDLFHGRLRLGEAFGELLLGRLHHRPCFRKRALAGALGFVPFGLDPLFEGEGEGLEARDGLIPFSHQGGDSGLCGCDAAVGGLGQTLDGGVALGFDALEAVFGRFDGLSCAGLGVRDCGVPFALGDAPDFGGSGFCARDARLGIGANLRKPLLEVVAGRGQGGVPFGPCFRDFGQRLHSEAADLGICGGFCCFGLATGFGESAVPLCGELGQSCLQPVVDFLGLATGLSVGFFHSRPRVFPRFRHRLF